MDSLVVKARSGDAEALEQLLGEIAPRVFRFGMRMCRHEADAQDVLQDTLISIATHLPEFEGRSSLSSWVFALTRSACTRRRRGLKNQAAAPLEDAPEKADTAPNPESQTVDRQLASALSAALDSLTEEYREVILLRDVEGLSAQEAAESIGISVDALKSRLHRAREALRASLKPYLEPTAPAPAPTCPNVASLWSKKLEGDLSQQDCAKIEKHIHECAACGSACDALRQALLACRLSAGEAVSPEVQARVKAAVKALSLGHLK